VPGYDLSAGELLKLGEGLVLEQSGASVYALATGLLANRAVAMVRSVASAFLGAVGACPDASLKQAMNDVVIPLSWSREDASGDLAQIRARHAQRDTRAHRGDVVLRQVRVHARRARLQTIQASVNGRRKLRSAAWNRNRRDIQDVSRAWDSPTSSM
jgi:hypothetical protein